MRHGREYARSLKRMGLPFCHRERSLLARTALYVYRQHGRAEAREFIRLIREFLEIELSYL